MKLENQVVSLKYAKRLKELGFKQDSYWYWYNGKGFEKNPTLVHPSNPYRKVASAFSVAELGEMLTQRKNIRKRREKIMALPNEKCIFNSDYWAKMLIYLKENKLI